MEKSKIVNKKGKATEDLYCQNCKKLVFTKDEQVPSCFLPGEERCCEDCDHTLYRRTNGGQGKDYGLITKKEVKQQNKGNN